MVLSNVASNGAPLDAAPAAPAPPDGRGGPHVFVDDLDCPVLSDEDQHHLKRVRRLRVGAPITISDGLGSWRSARYGAAPELTGDIVHVARRSPIVSIAMSPVKGDRTATAVQKLSELGVDRIIMFQSARSVVRWDSDRAFRAISRLQTVARSAASQSRQVWMPMVEGPANLRSILLGPGVAVAERGGFGVDLSLTTILIGPEGGWDEEEIDPLLPRVGLGVGVLRAETAAITAGVLLTALRDGLVHSHSE